MSVLAVIGTYRHRIDTIVCFSEGWKSGFVPCNLNKAQACTLPSFYFFFLAAWASGNDAFRAETTAQIPIRLLTDFLCSQKHSKVSFELPEGFSVTAEKWQQQGMFRVTPKTLLPTAYLPKSISLFDAQSSFLFVPLQDKILINGKNFWDCLLSFQGLPKDYHLTFYVQGAKRLDKFCQ